FTIDTIKPNVNLLYPLNITYKINISTLNFSVSDINLQSCWYSTNGGTTNITTSCAANITGLTSTEGSNTWLIGANDTANNKNMSQITFFKDTVYPLITIVSPLNQTYTATTINFNVSLNEAGSWCGLSLDNAANITMTANSSNTGFGYTNSTMTQGSHSVVFACNDTAGNMNASSGARVFSIDTISPALSIIYPANATYNVNVSELNYTSNGVSCWYSNNSGAWNSTPAACGTNFTNVISVEGSNTWTLYANDSANNINSTSVTFFKDTVYPLINYGTGTENNNANFSRSWVYVNVSFTETNFANITFTLKNDTNTINTTIFTTQTYTINWTGLADNNYTYFVNITDSANNKNSTAIRMITIDDTAPSISIVYPLEGGAYSFNNISINYTISDNLIGLSSCWYTNNSGANNYSITCGQNFSQNLSDGSYTYTVYSNDSLNNLGSDSVNFTISTGAPAINLDSPLNNKWFNSGSNVYFNFTATDSNGIDTCQLWANWTGGWSVNYTWVSPSSGIMNYTTRNLPNGVYIWNIWCNDTTNAGQFYTNNFTVGIDSIVPLIGYGTGTENNNANFSRSWVYVNVSFTETNFANITFTLKNDTNTINTTTFTTPTYTINWTGLADNNYTYFANITDSANNKNSTAIRIINLDSVVPALSIIYPANITYNVNVSNLNYTSNGVSCWYSNNSGIWNSTPVSCGTNFTNVISVEGSNTWTLYANDSANNINSTSVTFFKDTVYPLITIVSPANNTNSSDVNLDVNYTRNDANLQSCWYSNDTYAVNTTLAGCINITTVIWAEGQHNVTVWANDSAGNKNSSFVRFTIDTIIPTITIISPLNTTYNISSINFNVSSSDTLSYCLVTLNDWATNYTMTLNSLLRGANYTNSSIADGSYTAKFWCNDTANNINNTNQITFSVESMQLNSCVDLDSANLVYVLTQNVTSTGTCFTVSAGNVTLDCQGYKINYSTAGAISTYGVYSDQDHTTIKNCTIADGNTTTSAVNRHGIYFSEAGSGSITNNNVNVNSSRGIYLASSSNNTLSYNTGTSNSNIGIYLASSSNNTLSYNTGTSNSVYGIYLASSSNNTLSYNTGTSNSSAAIRIYKGTNNTLIGNNATGFLTGSYGLYIKNNTGTTIKDCVDIRGVAYDVYIDSDVSTNIIILNCSYDLSKESVNGAGNILTRKWYYQAYVNDTNGDNISGANITAYNNTEVYNFNLTTNNTGYTQLGEIIDYANKGGTRGYYSLYNIYAIKSNYTRLNHTWNATLQQNNRDAFIFSFDIISPALSIVYPANTTYNINVSNLNYTFTETDPSSCWYSNNSGIWNSTPAACGTNFTNAISVEGSNTWTLYANDSANNINSTSVTFFKDSIPPSVGLISVINITTTQLDYRYNVSDNSSIANCSLMIDGIAVAYDTNVSNNGANESIIYTTPEGTHTYLISCIDEFLNIANSSSGTVIISTTTTTIISEGGGGGGTKTISLKIEVPSSINLEEKGKVEIPITIDNNGQTDLKEVTLAGYVLKNSALSNLKVEFDKGYFESIKKNTKEEVILTVEVNAEEIAVYEIVINASSASPVYNAKATVYLNFVGKEVSGVKKMVIFAEDMIVENPECMELKEIVEEARKAFEEGNFQEAIVKSNKAVEACRESISGPKQSIIPSLKNQGDIIIYLGIGVILLVILILIFSIYKRIRFRRKQIKALRSDNKPDMPLNS
ncbi:MAG: hypothetical protein Q8N63_00030, partial [Nanoarchaeota archaeon]|nr:hypothetical protein [Nanoarchaeota archaeon]